MKIEIRLANRQDEAVLCRLFEQCFGDAPTDTQRYFAQRNAQDRTWVLCEDGTVAAMVTAMPLSVDAMQGVYIYAVGTAPQHRGKGYMHRLLQVVTDILRAEGVACCLLTPADEQLEQTYRRMGFTDFAPVFRTRVRAGQSLPIKPLDQKAFVRLHRQNLQSKPHAAVWPEETLRYFYRQMQGAGGGAAEYRLEGQTFYVAYTPVGDTVYVLEDSGPQPKISAAALAAYLQLPFAQVRTAYMCEGMQRTPPVLWRAPAQSLVFGQGYLAFLLDI